LNEKSSLVPSRIFHLRRLASLWVKRSAYERGDGTSFDIDSREGSARDIAFLISYAHLLSDVDWNRIGIIGHSGGAQAAMSFRSQGNSAVDALVSLDTTQDYYSLLDTRWGYFTSTVSNNIKNMSGPMLLFADQRAIFQLCDSMQYARRYYFTIDGLDHNEFISQGVIRKRLQLKLHFSSPGPSPANPLPANQAEEKVKLEKVEAGYKAVCEYTLNFLDANLKDSKEANDIIKHQYRSTGLGSKEITRCWRFEVSLGVPSALLEVEHLALANNNLP
jgi:pimeloyl-ACP methyl ester carboxylesterase